MFARGQNTGVGKTGIYTTFITSATTNGVSGVDLGFTPSRVVLFIYTGNTYGAMVVDWDVTNSKYYLTYYTNNHSDSTASFASVLYMKTATYLELKSWTTAVQGTTAYVMAIP